jgi:UDP-glucuronate decarboxylase
MNQTQILGPVNLGNPEELTVLGLAKEVIKQTGSRSKIAFRDLPEDDPVRRQPDITLAKTVLSWEPMISLQVGLSRTIPYFKKALEKHF